MYQFRPLEKVDFAMVAAWIGQPHVQKWWQEPATVEHVAKEYGPCTDGDFKTRVYVVELDGTAMGMMQCYRVEDYAETDSEWDTSQWDAAGYVGIDYLIGDVVLTGKGHGTAMIKAFVEEIVKSLYPEAVGALADPEVANAVSQAALRKAGFRPYKVIPEGEHGTPEQLMTLRFS